MNMELITLSLICFLENIFLAFYALGHFMEILVEVNLFKEFLKILGEKINLVEILIKFFQGSLNGMIPFLDINVKSDKWYENYCSSIKYSFLFLFGLWPKKPI